MHTHTHTRSAHANVSMASVDPITPSTASAVVTSAANASLSPNESTVTLPQPEPPPTSPMDTSSLVVPEVAFTLPVVQPVLNDVTIKPESPTASSAATTNSAATTTSNPLKRPRHKPGERKELLERAVRDVREQNISMRKAASRYNLPKSSFCDYVRKNHIILPNNRCKPSAAAVAAAAAAATSGANNSSAGEHQLNHHHARLDSASASQSSGALQPPPLSAGGQAGLFSFPLDTSGLLRATHTSTPPGAGSASVLSRLESPWNNVSGLPTQVPMQNWSSLATATAHGKSMGLLSQVSNASSPKQPEVSSSSLSFIFLLHFHSLDDFVPIYYSYQFNRLSYRCPKCDFLVQCYFVRVIREALYSNLPLIYQFLNFLQTRFMFVGGLT